MLWTPQGFLRSAILSFDAEGRVVEITTREAIDSCEGVEFFNGILIPGLVNTHCHSELSYLRGKIARHSGFAGFADGMARVRHEATPEERLAAVRYWDTKMFQEGITAVGDICNGDSTFDIKLKSKIHYHNFIEYFGLRCTDFSPMDCIVDKASQIGLRCSPTPHATYSLQDAPFRDLAQRGDPLSIHFMESKAETELFFGCGTLHDRNQRMGVTIDFAHYGSPAERIMASTPSNKRILLIHNTFVDESIVERMEAYFASGKLTWVLCPRSNDYIEGTHPPATLLMNKGVRIALGTDSLASNESLSLVEEMKLLPEIPLHERIRWATQNGAEALGIADWAGSFEVGKHPGAVLLEGVDFGSMSLRTDARTRRII